MNQNPPRGPGNPFGDADKTDGFGLNPTPMQNQQAPPPGGMPPAGPPRGPGPGGPPPVPGGYQPGPGGSPPGPGGYPPPGPGHFPPPAGPGYSVNPYDTTVMSTKDWLIVFLISIIPCVNIIMWFVWAFSGSGNHNRRNYARAYLIFIAIVIGLYLFAALFFGAMFANMFMWL